jgi:ATP phosphoribosyltransferase regulatory subunit
VRSVGLSEFRIELSEVGVGRALLNGHGEDLLALSAEALAQKDETQLRQILKRAGLSASECDRVAALAHLHGDLSVLPEARKLLAGTAAEAHLAQLEQVASQLEQGGLGSFLGVDLGEIRGAAYYTGVSFAIFAPGPGEAVASGGRYDQLLERYGKPQPATGAGIDLENLLWALDHAGHSWRERSEVRFLVHGPDVSRRRRVADALHQRGLVAAVFPSSDAASALAYANAWAYDVCIDLAGTRAIALRVADGRQYEIGSEPSGAEIEAVSVWARAAQKE